MTHAITSHRPSRRVKPFCRTLGHFPHRAALLDPAVQVDDEPVGELGRRTWGARSSRTHSGRTPPGAARQRISKPNISIGAMPMAKPVLDTSCVTFPLASTFWAT
jgi:hypothetical protein